MEQAEERIRDKQNDVEDLLIQVCCLIARTNKSQCNVNNLVAKLHFSEKVVLVHHERLLKTLLKTYYINYRYFCKLQQLDLSIKVSQFGALLPVGILLCNLLLK